MDPSPTTTPTNTNQTHPRRPSQSHHSPQLGILPLNQPPNRTRSIHHPSPPFTTTATSIGSPSISASASRAPLTPLPPPPSTLLGDGSIYRHWLNAKTWEDRRMQETQRTKQEALKLEQRRYELSMLRDALRAGVPSGLVPVLFGGAVPSGCGEGGSDGGGLNMDSGRGMGMGVERGMSRREGVERARSRREGVERAHSRRDGMERALSSREANVPAPGSVPGPPPVPAPAPATAPGHGPGPTPNPMHVHGVVAPSGRSSTSDADRVRRQVQFLNSAGQAPMPAPARKSSGHRSRHHHRENGQQYPQYSQAELERRDYEIAELRRTRDALKEEKQHIQRLTDHHVRMHEEAHRRHEREQQFPSLSRPPTVIKIEHSDDMSVDDKSDDHTPLVSLEQKTMVNGTAQAG